MAEKKLSLFYGKNIWKNKENKNADLYNVAFITIELQIIMVSQLSIRVLNSANQT